MTKIPGKQLLGDFLDFVSGSFRSRLSASSLTANNDLKLPTESGVLATKTTRSIALENLVGPGIPLYSAGAGVPVIATQTQLRDATGMGSIATQQSSDVSITGGIVNGVSLAATNTFNSSANLGTGFWAGVDTTPRCVFSAGSASTSWTIDNNNGDFRWFTPGNVRMSIRASDSMLSAYGPIVPKLYTPQSRPSASSLYYGAMIAIYDPNFSPAIYIAVSDLTNWHRISGTTLLP